MSTNSHSGTATSVVPCGFVAMNMKLKKHQKTSSETNWKNSQFFRSRSQMNLRCAPKSLLFVLPGDSRSAKSTMRLATMAG